MQALRGRKSPKISNSHCNLKIFHPSAPKRNLSISIRLVKTPPVLSIHSPTHPISISKSPPGIKPSALTTRFHDPTDFIEPIPNTKDFIIQPANNREYCPWDTLPIPLKHDRTSPKFNFRVIIQKKSLKTSNCKFFQ